MIKYYDKCTTFAEFPDEIALCVNISNCIGTCDGCSEPWLREDIGTELTEQEVDKLIKENPDITLFGFMGGDRDHNYILHLTRYIHEHYNIKVGMYSGRDYLNLDLAKELDCYKIGRFIMPKGPVDTWSKQNCGPITFPFSNQIYYERHGDILLNCTYKFRTKTLNDLEKQIIK